MVNRFEEYRNKKTNASVGHEGADTDQDINSIHHTLGYRSNQAAPGDHKHDDRYTKTSEATVYESDIRAPGITGDVQLTRWGRTVELSFYINTPVALAANAAWATTPPGYRPMYIWTSTRYFSAWDAATGGHLPMALDWQGKLCCVFARAAGASIVGTITYITEAY